MQWGHQMGPRNQTASVNPGGKSPFLCMGKVAKTGDGHGVENWLNVQKPYKERSLCQLVGQLLY